jgi:ATP-binding cassette, subfamily C, bacterial CydC
VFEVFGPVPLALASWRQVRAAATRIAETVPSRIPAEIPQEPVAVGTGAVDAGAVDAVGLGDGIRLSGVDAHWPRADASAQEGRLRGIDLHVRPGERVLIAGPSGAGKTTLAHVLVRFLDYDGSYRIGGVEAAALPGDAVRRVVGLCEQTPYLFDESIRQNLLFAHDTAGDGELWDALGRVGLDAWVRDRGGLDARVGERGALVSGGQAQRLALARALLAGFPVLVLDEPTAGVDPEASDALLADLLAAVGPDRSVLLISHVDVPAGAIDRTLRMEDGRLVP